MQRELLVCKRDSVHFLSSVFTTSPKDIVEATVKYIKGGKQVEKKGKRDGAASKDGTVKFTFAPELFEFESSKCSKAVVCI